MRSIQSLITKSKLDAWYFILFFICVYLIYVASVIRCKHRRIEILEPDSKMYSKLKKYKLYDYGIDIWTLIHYGFYLLVGYLYPNSLIITMFLGLLWELFEFYIGEKKPKLMENIGFCTTDGKERVWWYGKFSDLIFNYLGFITGRYLARK